MRRKNALKVRYQPSEDSGLVFIVFVVFASMACGRLCFIYSLQQCFSPDSREEGPFKFPQNTKVRSDSKTTKNGVERRSLSISLCAICHSQKHEHVVRLFMHAFEYRYKIIRTTFNFLSKAQKSQKKCFIVMSNSR